MLSLSLSNDLDITKDGQNELSARHIKRRFKLKKKIKYNIICTDCIKCFFLIFILFNKFYIFLFLLNIDFNKQNITILNISIYILLILTMLVRVVRFISLSSFPTNYICIFFCFLIVFILLFNIRLIEK
jgi:hypothetical protein